MRNLLFNVDLPGLRRRRLRHQNAQDTILQARPNCILIDACRERKAAVELANRTLANPVSRLLSFALLSDILCLFRLLGDCVVVGASCRFVFDAWLKFLLLGCILNEALWALTFFADVFVAARDSDCVVVGPFDVDILLLDAREFAVEFVTLLGFFDVELWSERPRSVGEVAVDVAEGLAIILIEETEDGSELLSEAWEERHCCWTGCEESSGRRLSDALKCWA